MFYLKTKDKTQKYPMLVVETDGKGTLTFTLYPDEQTEGPTFVTEHTFDLNNLEILVDQARMETDVRDSKNKEEKPPMKSNRGKAKPNKRKTGIGWHKPQDMDP